MEFKLEKKISKPLYNLFERLLEVQRLLTYATLGIPGDTINSRVTSLSNNRRMVIKILRIFPPGLQ